MARAGWPPASARTSGSPRRPSGSSARRTRRSATSPPRSPARRSPRWPSPSPARARTSPLCAPAPSASTAAGWSTARRRTSPTACARTSSSPPCKTSQQGGHHGISFLIVDRQEGVTSAKLEKLGWHASDTATVAFDDVFVPEENLLGAEHEGFKLIMANFQWERLIMALGAVAGDAGRGRSHARLRARAQGLRPAAHRPPGDPPQARRPRHDRPHLPLRHATTRCSASTPARSPCAR